MKTVKDIYEEFVADGCLPEGRWEYEIQDAMKCFMSYVFSQLPTKFSIRKTANEYLEEVYEVYCDGCPAAFQDKNPFISIRDANEWIAHELNDIKK